MAHLVEARLDGAVGQTRSRKAALEGIAGGAALVIGWGSEPNPILPSLVPYARPGVWHE